MRIGVIGGTGFSLPDAEIATIDTPYGAVEVAYAGGIFFVKRHGRDHLPPHRVVHRANVDALARCRVDAIFAINAVGALDANIPVPSLLVPDDYLDLRKTTETFHDANAVHVDVSEAYCPALRALLVRHAGAAGTAEDPDAPAGALWAKDGGTYACTEGPRLETRAEVRMLHAMGGTVVGMTGCPEAALARERAMCYASLCLVVNAAAGVAHTPLVAEELRAGAAEMMPRAVDAVLRAAKDVRADRACRCRDALRGAAL